MAPSKHSWQDGLERKKSAPSLPLHPSLARFLLLVFLAEWSWRIAELCLNPVPGYLAPTFAHSLPTRASPPPSQTPAWTHVSHSEPSQYSRTGTGTVIVCLHYLCRCTVCGKWLRNAIIHSCHPALPSIRLMIFCRRPGFPGCWNHECEKEGERCLIGGPWSNSSVWTHRGPVVPLSSRQKFPAASKLLRYSCRKSISTDDYFKLTWHELCV